MIQEAIEGIFGKAQALADATAKAEAVELKGLPYILHGATLKELKTPLYPGLPVGSLAGFVEAVKLVKGLHAIIVQSATTVVGVTDAVGAWLQRDTLVAAQQDKEANFQWGTWHEADDFIIALQAKFGQTPDRDKLVKILGNLSGGVLRTSTDDGISQSVSVRAGVTLLGEEKISNPVTLRPYRTFHDVEQPASPFVVRLKQDKDQAPKIALFEADGGLWKRTAIESIYTYLSAAKLAVPVLR